MSTATACPMIVFDLCQRLHAEGLVLAAQSRTTLSLSPRAKVTAAIAEAITYHKPALLRLLINRPPLTPFACRFCGAEFVSAATEDCLSCAQVRRMPMRFAPKSPEEGLLLAAVERRKMSGKTVPTLPVRSNRAIGDSSLSQLSLSANDQ